MNYRPAMQRGGFRLLAYASQGFNLISKILNC
jgi:hypothetical protein